MRQRGTSLPQGNTVCVFALIQRDRNENDGKQTHKIIYITFSNEILNILFSGFDGILWFRLSMLGTALKGCRKQYLTIGNIHRGES